MKLDKNLKRFLLNATLGAIYGIMIVKASLWLGDWLSAKGIGNEGNGSIITLGAFAAYLIFVQIRFHFLQKKMKAVNHAMLEDILGRQRNIFRDDEIPDRLEVNAALDKIIESRGEDNQAITSVLKFCSRLPFQNTWHDQIEKKSSGKSFRGLTNLGEIDVKEDRHSDNHDVVSNKVRVGQYKVWRNISAFFFQHFWSADPLTAGNPLDAYRGYAIFFDTHSFLPRGFGPFEYEEVKRSPFGPKLIVLFVDIVSGELKGERIPFGVLQIR